MYSMDDYIKQHAAQDPAKIAMTFGGQSVTYPELADRCRSMAVKLSAHRLAPGDVVAVVCERSIDLMVAVLAVLRLDCVYLPIDKLNPRQRVDYILENSDARLIIADEPLEADSRWPQVTLDSLLGPAEGEPELPPGENQGFCIMYTSGTTGRPKGTPLHKAGVFNHLDAKIQALSMDGDSVVAQNAGYFFVNSMWQMFAPLVVGGRLVIYDRHIMSDLDRLAAALREDRVSIFQAVPSFWNRFFDHVEETGAAFPDLCCIVSTSEKLNHPLVEKCFRCFPGCRLVNAYGQTECSDDVLHYVMDSVPREPDIPIGTPAPNTRIYILDEEDRLCADGERGEICAAGMGLSGGYLNAPEQTAAAFVRGEDVGLDEPYLYRTGDIGYRREDGNIVYLGRKDFQVKIHGYRVELYEIENVLLQYPGISQAAVIYLETEGGGRLIAFYTAAGEIDQGELSGFLRTLLPSYMVPREFVPTQAFPLTAMGKIDRKQLKAELEARA